MPVIGPRFVLKSRLTPDRKAVASDLQRREMRVGTACVGTQRAVTGWTETPASSNDTSSESGKGPVLGDRV